MNRFHGSYRSCYHQFTIHIRPKSIASSIPSRFFSTCDRSTARQFSTSPQQSRLLRLFRFSEYSRYSRFRFSARSNVLIAAAPLPLAAFVSLSQSEQDDGKTGEERMLEVSRAELDSHVPSVIQNSKHWRKSIFFWLDIYIYEPICTTIRFLHLFIIFVPVILTIPAIWLGRRLPDRDNETSGTIWWYGFLVSSMERAGAAFIKLGQWAASRTDIFPTEMCSIMSSLHSNAPPHSLHETTKILEKAFGGQKMDHVFEEFDTTPLGVGAIAQVYKAKLKPDFVVDGNVDIFPSSNIPTLTQQLKANVDFALKSSPGSAPPPSSYVAVKVLHPGVDRMVQRDLRIMGLVASILNLIPTIEWLSLPDEVAVFGSMMKLQLDLRIEAANLARFRKNFVSRTTAWFPFAYTQYSSRQVLIEEFAEGVPLESILTNGGGPFEKEIADEGLNAFLHMLLLDNFTHADLHPGNIMVRFYKPHTLDFPTLWKSRHRDSEEKAASFDRSATDTTEEVLNRLMPLKNNRTAWLKELDVLRDQGYTPQLIFIDAGLSTELNDVNRENFLALFKAVAEFDGYKAGHLMVERSRQPDTVLDPEVFALRMQHLVLGVKSKTFALGNIKIGDVLTEVLGMVRKHHVRLEGDFINVVLSILLLEGIGRQLDPDMDLFAGALPILRQLGAQKSKGVLKEGVDFSMIKVWAGLEARSFLQASIEDID